MTHEIECALHNFRVIDPRDEHLCICLALRHAYQRGYATGFNDHARTLQHWQDTHGAYRQHGEGENP
jgi:hypothetical protein